MLKSAPPPPRGPGWNRVNWCAKHRGTIFRENHIYTSGSILIWLQMFWGHFWPTYLPRNLTYYVNAPLSLEWRVEYQNVFQVVLFKTLRLYNLGSQIVSRYRTLYCGCCSFCKEIFYQSIDKCLKFQRIFLTLTKKFAFSYLAFHRNKLWPFSFLEVLLGQS